MFSIFYFNFSGYHARPKTQHVFFSRRQVNTKFLGKTKMLSALVKYASREAPGSSPVIFESLLGLDLISLKVFNFYSIAG